MNFAKIFTSLCHMCKLLNLYITKTFLGESDERKICSRDQIEDVCVQSHRNTFITLLYTFARHF